MKISAKIKSKLNQLENIVQANEESKAISIASKTNGYGSSVKGGELLMLALATCYCNSIYREASKKSLLISEVEVLFTGDFGEISGIGSNFQYTVNVVSDAPPNEIKELIIHSDKVAVVSNILRKGLSISLAV